MAEVVGDALALISERAAKTGQSALGGLLGLGAAEIAQAAGLVGMDVARAFGLAEKVSRLYTICRSFIAQAFESLVALLGLGVAQTAAGKVVEWVGELKDGKLLDDLLARMYDTERTASYLSERIESSQADLDAYLRTIGQWKPRRRVRTTARLVGEAPQGAAVHRLRARRRAAAGQADPRGDVYSARRVRDPGRRRLPGRRTPQAPRPNAGSASGRRAGPRAVGSGIVTPC
ncbi:MAG: hypothetical protein WKH64_04515 [Chloroflexia bacterium]